MRDETNLMYRGGRGGISPCWLLHTGSTQIHNISTEDTCDRHIQKVAKRENPCELLWNGKYKAVTKKNVSLPGWTKEDQASDRLLWVVETSPRALNGIGNNLYSLVLADHPPV